jgi:hypothetical protein
VNLENERILISAIKSIDKASFSKTSLEFFKGIPETIKSVFKFSGSSSNEKLLAAQVYGKLLEKFGSFGKEIKAKQIIPSKEELSACEEVIDSFYNSNKELLRDVPETATELKINEIQPVLSDLKVAVQQMKKENPNPNPPNNDKTLLVIVTFVVIVGLVVVGIFSIFKFIKRRSSVN